MLGGGLNNLLLQQPGQLQQLLQQQAQQQAQHQHQQQQHQQHYQQQQYQQQVSPLQRSASISSTSSSLRSGPVLHVHRRRHHNHHHHAEGGGSGDAHHHQGHPRGAGAQHTHQTLSTDLFLVVDDSADDDSGDERSLPPVSLLVVDDDTDSSNSSDFDIDGPAFDAGSAGMAASDADLEAEARALGLTLGLGSRNHSSSSILRTRAHFDIENGSISIHFDDDADAAPPSAAAALASARHAEAAATAAAAAAAAGADAADDGDESSDTAHPGDIGAASHLAGIPPPMPDRAHQPQPPQPPAGPAAQTDAVYFPRHVPPGAPILPRPLASVVSTVSMASRLSLRIASAVVGTVFGSLQLGASTTLGLGRRALVSAVSSARSLHSMAMRRGNTPSDQTPFFNVLNNYTNTSIYVIHNLFSLAELLTLSTFHLASSTINFSLSTAEECVQVLDGLFGDTDTSKTLAAVICIFLDELKGQDDELGLSTRFGKLYAVGQITKSMTAYCCLQFVTRKHWRSLIKLKPVFVGRVDKTGAYDPANEPFTLNIFNTTGPAGKSSRKTFPSKQAKTWPEEVPTMRQRKIQRRRSLEALALQTLTPVIRSSQHAALSSVSASASASTPDLFGTVPRRRRALSGPHTDVTALANVMQMLDSAQMTRRGMSPAPPATTPATSAPPSPRHATSASAAVAAAAAAGEAGARGGSSMTLNSVGGTTAASTVRSSVGNQTGRSMPTPPLDSSVMSGSTRAGNGSFVAMQEDPKISFPPPLQPRPQPQPQQQQQQQVQQPQQPQPPALHVPPAAEPVTAPGPEDGQGGPSQASASDGPEIWTRTPEGHIEMASRFIKFAIGAYGSSFLKIMGLGKARDHLPELDGDHYNHQSLAFHANIPVEHIVSSSFVTPSTLEPPTLIAPVHYVVVDRQSKSVVVSLRGTLGISDIVTDLMASYVRYKTADNLEGFVHSGMFKSAQKIATGPVREAVAESLRRHPGYALILTGHSLGGGCAALLAMMWARRITTVDGQEGFVLDERAGLPRRPIHCYVFGVPAIMSPHLSRSFKSLISCFIFRNDIVPCLSLGLVRDFRNVTVNLCNEKGMAERVIGKVLGIFRDYTPTGAPDEDSLWYWALLKTLRADMKAEKLYPPGTVYWINANTTPDMVPSLGRAARAGASPSPAPRATPSPTPDPSDAPTPTPTPTPTSSALVPAGASSGAVVVSPKKTIPISIHEVDDVEIAFSELVFSTKMFTDHSPHHYEGSLELVSRALAKLRGE